MADLKAGGLAIVIRSHSAENIGKVVKLLDFYGEGSGPYKGRSDMWFVTPISSKIKSQLFPVSPGEKCSCPAAFLMPIEGDDFQHEDEQQKELTHG
ncbi:hypothetical protein IFU25_08090 [Pantoea agglomerans]|uniref:hypothetical protein n=1 Tax=Enterobacter agglomerans TaxID=549 RepID=UPI001783569B|nr:hypothetical protein [Pantoea agglomerans]MBD8181661.1 hypothetical protein [Pantoea agglomerans]